MDKKELKQITTKVYEEYGFVKKGKYYYLDLEEVIICSGFSSIYGITYLAFNFSVKATNSEEDRKPNNMFDGYDSFEIEMYFDRKAEGYHKKEIRYEEWDKEYNRLVPTDFYYRNVENITAEHAFHMILLQFFANNEEWMVDNELLVNGELQVYTSKGNISAGKLLSIIIENL